MNRVLAIKSLAPASGARTLASGLAHAWLGTDQAALIMDPERPAPAAPEDAERLARLPPAMLRNYLSSECDGLRRVGIPQDASAIASILALSRLAFPWTMVLLPDARHPVYAAILDVCDLVLWVAVGTSESEELFAARREALAALHYPHALSRLVLNRCRPGGPRHGNALAHIPDDPGLREGWWAAVAALAERLSKDASVYPPRRAAENPEAAIGSLKHRVQPELVELVGGDRLTAETAQATVEQALASDPTLPASRVEREKILSRVLDDVLGLGPIEALLKDPEISEVMVNGPAGVFVEKKGRLHPCPVRFASEAQLRAVIDRIVTPIGRRVDEAMPLCDARLPDGSRVNIILPPLALDGPMLTIRKFSSKRLGFDELVSLGSMSASMAEFLRHAVLDRKNILVSGGTGSGKTTLLNALSGEIPDDERIVTIEDAAELRLHKPHVVRLEARPANAEGQGDIPIRRLVANALRMRPDRIVVGECRGGEALDMLQAMNTGHDGSLTTVHANSPRDALGRLETLVLMAGLDLPVRVVREQIRSAIDLIIQQARLSDGTRKITAITEVTGMEGDTLLTQDLFRYSHGQFEQTGVPSR